LIARRVSARYHTIFSRCAFTACRRAVFEAIRCGFHAAALLIAPRVMLISCRLPRRAAHAL